MHAARLDTLHLYGSALDTETHRIQPGVPAPPLVVGSCAEVVDGAIAGTLLERETTIRAFVMALDDPQRVIIGANIAYDMLVIAVELARRGIDAMPAIFAAYQQGRVYDIQVAEALHAIAEGHLGKDPRTSKQLKDPITGKMGRYSLSICTDLVLGRIDAKRNDRWRQSYALLEHVPIAEWPEDARTYPVDDARNTLEVALAQCGLMPNVGLHRWRDGRCLQCGTPMTHDAPVVCVSRWRRRNLHTLADEVYTSWALHLGASWGLRTDAASVDALEAAARAGREANMPDLVRLGYLRADGSENGAVVKRAVALAYGCSGVCGVCGGTQKVPSPKSGNPINCSECSATGLNLDSAPVPRTDPSTKFPKGQVQTGRDILTESGDEDLMFYGYAQEDDKILDTYCPDLRKGCAQPVNLRPNNPLETGRVSYTGGELVLGTVQLLPRQVSARLLAELKRRGGHVIGVRDCIVPDPGWLFYSNDFSGGELVTFAESCVLRVGFSELGKALNLGLDAHAALGATMLGWPMEKMAAVLKDKAHPEHKRAKNFRQCAKWGNFGFMGGMGELKFTLTQRRQGADTPHPSGPSQVWDGEAFVAGYRGMRLCILVDGADACGKVKVTEYKRQSCPPTCKACIDVAKRIRESWLRQWPEAKPYLEWHSNNADTIGEVVQHYSNRIRGGARFCAESNGDFQGLLADVAKRAQCRVSLEQYVRVIVDDPTSRYYGQLSPLYGVSRSIFFAHDELFGVTHEDVGHDVSCRVNEIMVEEFRKACPNHAPACKAEPTLMGRWWKAAEPVWHRGRLAAWSPSHNQKTCQECRA